MRKLFDIKYKDGGMEKKASARINEEEQNDIDSRYFILLPFWTDEKGREHYDYITRAVLDRKVFGKEMEGWRFTSSLVNSRFYMFDFWILGDGTMLCNEPEGNTRQYRMIPGKFDRLKEPRTDAERTAKMMYDIVKQVYEMDKIGMLAETVGVVRQKRLDTALRIIGYESPDKVRIRMNEEEAYCNIRRARNILENYRNIAYVYKEKSETGEESYTVDYDAIPFADTDRSYTLDSYEITTGQVKLDNDYMAAHQEWVSAIRNIPGLSNFLLDMENRIGKTDPEGYKNYCNVSRRIAEILLGLNPDLVDNPRDLTGIADLTALQGEELSKRIRRHIGEKDFEKACEFEDRWYLAECERAVKIIEESKEEKEEETEETQETQESEVDPLTVITLKEVTRRLQMSKEQKAKILEEFDNLRSLYSKKSVVTERKFEPDASDNIYEVR